VDSVLVGGQFVKRDGRLVGIDAGKLMRDATESAERIRQRAGGRLAERNLVEPRGEDS